jgi:hypothetical protein
MHVEMEKHEIPSHLMAYFEPVPGPKQKDLLGIPWAVAFALRDDGWYLRSEIIWHKPNPMPESVADRPTKSHEQIFLLAKSERYFFDQEAVREKKQPYAIPESKSPTEEIGKCYSAQWLNKRGRASRAASLQGSDRNIRSVWTIPTHPLPMAHFATFPPKLVEPCIKAGTSQAGCCPTCGKAWERVTEREGGVATTYAERGKRRPGVNFPGDDDKWEYNGGGEVGGATIRTLGFRQSCQCPPSAPVPCLVIDPFAGASTVGVVATGLGRRYVGLDLNAEYLEMSRRRIERPHAPARKVEKHHPLFAALEDAP